MSARLPGFESHLFYLIFVTQSKLLSFSVPKFSYLIKVNNPVRVLGKSELLRYGTWLSKNTSELSL
jgi:hypothetical protein